MSWPCGFEFTNKFIGQQTHEPRADWQVENLEVSSLGSYLNLAIILEIIQKHCKNFYGLDLSKGSVHGREAY